MGDKAKIFVGGLPQEPAILVSGHSFLEVEGLGFGKSSVSQEGLPQRQKRYKGIGEASPQSL